MPSLALAARAPIWHNKSANVTLSHVHNGKPPSNLHFPLEVQFAVNWNFNKGKGHASVVSINNVLIDKSKTDAKASEMGPLGIDGELDFMSKGKHTIYLNDGNTLIAYRVVLDMRGEEPEYAKRSAAIMIGDEGDDIVVSANWEEDEKQ